MLEDGRAPSRGVRMGLGAETLKSGKAPKTYPEGRKCATADCETELHIYNPGPLCHACQRVNQSPMTKDYCSGCGEKLPTSAKGPICPTCNGRARKEKEEGQKANSSLEEERSEQTEPRRCAGRRKNGNKCTTILRDSNPDTLCGSCRAREKIGG